MTQDPNARAEIEPTEVGANAAETGDRQLTPEHSPETPDALVRDSNSVRLSIRSWFPSHM